MVEQNEGKISRWLKNLTRTTQTQAVPSENQTPAPSPAEISSPASAAEQTPTIEVRFSQDGGRMIDLPDIIIERIEATAKPFSDTCSKCGGEVEHGNFPYKTAIASGTGHRFVFVQQMPADRCQDCKRFVHIDPPVITELKSQIAAKLKEEAQQGKNPFDSTIS